MDRYVRVEQSREPQPAIDENEVRIMSSGKLHSYVAYASTLLTEKGHSFVLLKGMGRAINKTVTVAEVLKRRIPGLHQITEISSVDLVDTWEPTEEGLSRLETTWHVSVIAIRLSLVPLPTDNPGYQPPLTEEERTSTRFGGSESTGRSRNRGEGRGRGGRGRGAPQPAASAITSSSAGPSSGAPQMPPPPAGGV